MVIHISNVRYVEDINSIPWNVNSWIEITDTIAESLMVEMNCPANGGSILGVACGRTI